MYSKRNIIKNNATKKMPFLYIPKTTQAINQAFIPIYK